MPGLPFLVLAWLRFQKHLLVCGYWYTGRRKKAWKWSGPGSLVKHWQWLTAAPLATSLGIRTGLQQRLQVQRVGWTKQRGCMVKHSLNCAFLDHTQTHTISLLPSSFPPFNWLLVGGLLFWNAYFLPLLFFCLGPWGEWKLAKRERIPHKSSWSIRISTCLHGAERVSLFLQHSKPGSHVFQNVLDHT